MKNVKLFKGRLDTVIGSETRETYSLKQVAITLCFCISVFWPISAVQSYTTEKPNLVAPQELTVALILSPPLIMLNSVSGDYDGIMVQATRRLAEKCGIRARFIEAPSWSRAYRMAIMGNADAIIPVSKSQERLAVFHYPTTPQYVLKISAFAAAKNGEKAYTGLQMFVGKRVGKLDNALVEKSFDEFVKTKRVQLSERPTVRSLFEGLLRGRLDYVVGDTLSGTFYAEQLGAKNEIIALEPPIGTSPEYLAFSHKSSLMKDTESALAKCLLQVS